jgi:hypothetical protein
MMRRPRAPTLRFSASRATASPVGADELFVQLAGDKDRKNSVDPLPELHEPVRLVS